MKISKEKDCFDDGRRCWNWYRVQGASLLVNRKSWSRDMATRCVISSTAFVVTVTRKEAAKVIRKWRAN